MFYFVQLSIIIRMSESKNATSSNMSNQDYFSFCQQGMLEKIYKVGDKNPRHNLAEILDDCIDAQSTKVKIIDKKSETSNIHIMDNGYGMTESEAQNAITTFKEKPNINDYIDGNPSRKANYGLKEALISINPEKPTVTRSFPKDGSNPQKINFDFHTLRKKGINHPDRPKFRFDMSEEDIKDANLVRRMYGMEENTGTDHTLPKSDKLTNECIKQFVRGLKIASDNDLKLLDSFSFRYGKTPEEYVNTYTDKDGIEHTLPKYNMDKCVALIKETRDVEMYLNKDKLGKPDMMICCWKDKEGKRWWLPQHSTHAGKSTRVSKKKQEFCPTNNAPGYIHVNTGVAKTIMPENSQYYDPVKTEKLSSKGSIGPYEQQFLGDTWKDMRNGLVYVPVAHREDLVACRVYRGPFGMSHIKLSQGAGGNITGGGSACMKAYFRNQWRREFQYKQSEGKAKYIEEVDNYICKPNKTKMKQGRADKHLETTIDFIFKEIEEEHYVKITSDLKAKRDAKADAERKIKDREVLRNRAENVKAYLAEGVTVEEATESQVRDAEEKKRDEKAKKAEKEAKKAEEGAKKAEEGGGEENDDDDGDESSDDDDGESKEHDTPTSTQPTDTQQDLITSLVADAIKEVAEENVSTLGEEAQQFELAKAIHKMCEQAKAMIENNFDNYDFRKEVEELLEKYSNQDNSVVAIV